MRYCIGGVVRLYPVCADLPALRGNHDDCQCHTNHQRCASVLPPLPVAEAEHGRAVRDRGAVVRNLERRTDNARCDQSRNGHGVDALARRNAGNANRQLQTASAAHNHSCGSGISKSATHAGNDSHANSLAAARDGGHSRGVRPDGSPAQETSIDLGADPLSSVGSASLRHESPDRLPVARQARSVRPQTENAAHSRRVDEGAGRCPAPSERSSLRSNCGAPTKFHAQSLADAQGTTLGLVGPDPRTGRITSDAARQVPPDSPHELLSRSAQARAGSGEPSRIASRGSFGALLRSDDLRRPSGSSLRTSSALNHPARCGCCGELLYSACGCAGHCPDCCRCAVHCRCSPGEAGHCRCNPGEG